MAAEIVGWIGNEALLQDLVRGFPLAVLLLVIVLSIFMLSRGADWMVDGVVHLGGEVPTLDDAENAEAVASQVAGVVEVREELHIASLRDRRR